MDRTLPGNGLSEIAGGLQVEQRLPQVGPWRRWLVVDKGGEGRRLLLSMAQRETMRAAGGDPDELPTRARQAQGVVHPGLTRVAEWGSVADAVWVLEEIGGGRPASAESLDAPSGKQLVAGLVHLVEGLGHAHGRGLVHGHVGSDSVLVERGTLRLAGLAAGAATSAGEDGPASDVIDWARMALAMITPLRDQRREAGPFEELLGRVVRSEGWTPGDGRQMAELAHRTLDTDEGRAEVVALRRRVSDQTRDDTAERPSMLKRFLRGVAATLIGVLSTVLTVALLAGAAAGGLLYALEGGAAEVSVPNTLGMAYDDAVTALGEEGLQVGTLRRVYRSDVQAGKVASTTPSPGMRVREGREIAMVVSRGSAEVKTPRIVGLQVGEAEKILEKAGLVLHKQGQRRSNAPVGEVVSQHPSAGSLLGRAAEVTVVLSGGADYGIMRVKDHNDEEQKILFRLLEITVPQGPAIQRVTVMAGHGDELTTVYDRPHRPGDRIPLELHGRQGKRFEVALDGETVYRTQL